MARRKSVETGDNTTWYEQVHAALAFPGLDYPTEGLSGEQLEIVHGARLLFELLMSEDRRALEEEQALLAAGGNLQESPNARFLIEQIESRRSRVRMALNLLRSVIVTDAHPIQKMMAISRGRNLRGRPAPSMLGASIRALIAAFVDTARDRLELTEAAATKLVERAFRLQNLIPPSSGHIRSLSGSEAHGRGSPDYKFCYERFQEVPNDALEKMFAYDLARLVGPEALGSLLDKLITSPPVVRD
jgi:hypothetical protein